MLAPASLPLIAPSKVVGVELPVKSADVNLATDVPTFERLILDAKPVTTTSSKRAEPSSKTTSKVVLEASTALSCPA